MVYVCLIVLRPKDLPVNHSSLKNQRREFLRERISGDYKTVHVDRVTH